MTDNRKVISRRPMTGIATLWPEFIELDPARPLSSLLAKNNGDKLFLCGSLDAMTREYMLEPLDNGWEIEGTFVFKHRTAIYYNRMPPTKRVTVKLTSHRESWFPGCEDAGVAFHAWTAFASEWPKDVPILSTPAATGKALLWENFPKGQSFPALPDDLARSIRAWSPQHRIQALQRYLVDLESEGIEPKDCIQYDGRWMYAAMCGLDRFPIGEPRHAEGFTPYVPGWYDVTIRIPETWAHVGLIPILEDTGTAGVRAWRYPSEPGRVFRAWVAEPELTLAIEGVKKFDLPAWEIMDFHDGYCFEKGRPLVNWAQTLIEMRHRMQEVVDSYGATPDTRTAYRFAAAAVRQILNHTIGAIHKNEYQRETFISDDNFRIWRRENPRLAQGEDVLRVEGGYMVPCFVADNSPLSIFMPHWSGTIYSLARARVAEWALLCDPSTLVKIHGDAIYSTIEQLELDKLGDQRDKEGDLRLGQPRRKS